MTRLTSWILGATIALASIYAAHAADSVGGAWKLTVGLNDAPCTLTLTPDDSGTAGAISAGSDCPSGLDAVSTFKTVGSGLQRMRFEYHPPNQRRQHDGHKPQSPRSAEARAARDGSLLQTVGMRRRAGLD